MFIFRADVILREIEKYLPKLHKSLMEIYKHIGEEDEEKVIKEHYKLNRWNIYRFWSNAKDKKSICD